MRATTRVRGLKLGGRGCSPRSRESTHPPPAAGLQSSRWAESPSVSRPPQVPLLLEVLSDPQGWGVAAPFLLPAADAIIPAALTPPPPRPRPCFLVTAVVGGQDLVCESWSARALTSARLGGLNPPLLSLCSGLAMIAQWWPGTESASVVAVRCWADPKRPSHPAAGHAALEPGTPPPPGCVPS